MVIATQDRVQVFTFAKSKEIDIPDALSVSDTPVDAKQFGVFRIMTAKDGDRRIVWNRLSLVEIKEARKMFNNLIKEGMVPYLVGTGGKASSEVMDEFDPLAEEVIFLPVSAIVGG